MPEGPYHLTSESAVAPADSERAAALGQEFRRIRTQHLKVSQEQMAIRIGVAGYSQGGRAVSTARATLSRLENGTRTPTNDILGRYLALSDQPEATAECMAHLNPRPAAAQRLQRHEVAGPVDDVPEGPSSRPPPRRRWLVGFGVTAVVVAVAAVVVAGLSPDDDDRRTRVQTWTQTTGTPAHTWSDYEQAGGRAGKPLGPRQSVQVSCRVRGYVVADGDPWWYRLEGAPWDGHYYATSDAFYNQGSVSGPVDTGVIVDEQVPVC